MPAISMDSFNPLNNSLRQYCCSLLPNELVTQPLSIGAILREIMYVQCLAYSKPSKSGHYYYSQRREEGTEAWAT